VLLVHKEHKVTKGIPVKREHKVPRETLGLLAKQVRKGIPAKQDHLVPKETLALLVHKEHKVSKGIPVEREHKVPRETLVKIYGGHTTKINAN
jgi:hypothetical protein